MSEVRRYRRNQPIEAIQWDGVTAEATRIIQWVLDAGGKATFFCADADACLRNEHTILIGSVLHAGPGDYVVKDEVADSVGWRVVNPTTFHENYKEVQT